MYYDPTKNMKNSETDLVPGTSCKHKVYIALVLYRFLYSYYRGHLTDSDEVLI